MNANKKDLYFFARNNTEKILKKLDTSLNGLSKNKIDKSRQKYGDNKVTHQKQKSLTKRLFEAFINPFTVILIILASVSAFMDIFLPIYENNPEEMDYTAVVIILVMVFASGLLRFIQESRSGAAAEKLLAMITTTCTVTRKNKKKEIPIEKVVVGDIVHLSAGDMIPADMRIIESKDLFINQSSLTGESEPVEKMAAICENKAESGTEYTNLAFMGSNVVSGQGVGVVISVGNNTIFGSMTSLVAQEAPQTSFTKGVNKVSWVLIRFMLVMVPVVFFINGFTKGDWIEAFLFGISIAVGLTPEMLPMIVTTCLAKGAVAMSKKKTIIKNLNSIQNFGSIDILCTDKTGTLTQDRVALEYHLDIHGQEDDRILRHAFLNSYFQTGYKNLMDRSIIEKGDELQKNNANMANLSKAYVKVDEIPFDFQRRRLSVVVKDEQGKTQMITKGAVEEILSICSYVEYNKKIEPITQAIKDEVMQRVSDYSDDGFRVIALAQKTNPSPVGTFSIKDECDMVLLGYLVFLDPPKESTAQAIQVLQDHGVTTKILTGDNEKVTRNICKQVGLEVKDMLLGAQIAKMSDDELKIAVEKTNIFAKLAPDQKVRVIRVLRENGHVVGFMGDGINDAAAMKASDVGISVDSAVDIAKESADIILLDKDLMVLERGIIEGRKTYINMIKYIKMTASSNFGNMFSVLVASALLPFIPMLPIHLLLLNLIYDISCMSLPWDNVDEEMLKKPQNWDAKSVSSFMIWLGPTSSIFDWTTYAFMYFIFCPFFLTDGVLYNSLSTIFEGAELAAKQNAYEAMFQAGWFIESMWSQTLVIHMLRTPKIPFVKSIASLPVLFFTTVGIILLTIIPFTPLGDKLKFGALPWEYFLYLLPCIFLYMLLATSLKRAYYRYYSKLL